MSALAEALVAAQRSAVSALGKAYIAGALDAKQVTEKLEAVGLRDGVDQGEWLAALDVLKEHGAAAPGESKPSPEREKITPKQEALIMDLCRRKNVELPDLAGLSKAQGSEVIDSLNNSTYDATKWTIPF